MQRAEIGVATGLGEGERKGIVDVERLCGGCILRTRQSLENEGCCHRAGQHSDSSSGNGKTAWRVCPKTSALSMSAREIRFAPILRRPCVQAKRFQNNQLTIAALAQRNRCDRHRYWEELVRSRCTRVSRMRGVRS
jgi:hypothetical protein